MNQDTLQETLLRYLDGELTTAERQMVEERLKENADLRNMLAELERQVAHVDAALSMLAPTHEVNAQNALQRMYQREVQEKRNRMNNRTRRIAAIAAVAIVLAGSLALAPVRAFASDLLAVFRVERFVVVNVDDARVEELQAAFESLESEELIFGETETIREAGEPVEVGSIADAEAQVGISLRTPEGYGEPSNIAVDGASQTTITPDVEAMRQVYSAVGLDPEILPAEIDGQTFEVIKEPTAYMTYETEDNSFVLMQSEAPTTIVPDGVDTDALAIAVLQLLGMSESEAQTMAASIDFSTTLLLPIPTSDVELVREVSVDGTTGIMFEGDWDEETRGQGAMLMWQKNGVVTIVATEDAATTTVLDVAASLN